MKIVSVICVLITLSCCNAQQISISPIAVYKSKKYSKIDLIKLSLKGERYILGNTLQILNDSSFTYTTCAQKTKGKWWIRNDSLYIKCIQKEFLIDSFNHIGKYDNGTHCSQSPTVYKILHDGLYRRIKTENSGIIEEYLIRQ